VLFRSVRFTRSGDGSRLYAIVLGPLPAGEIGFVGLSGVTRRRRRVAPRKARPFVPKDGRSYPCPGGSVPPERLEGSGAQPRSASPQRMRLVRRAGVGSATATSGEKLREVWASPNQSGGRAGPDVADEFS
jgi:hypothetical protein